MRKAFPEYLKYYIKEYRNVFTREFCENAVDEMKKLEFKQHEFYNPTTEKYFSKENELSISWQQIPQHKQIMDTMFNYVGRYQELHLRNIPYWRGWNGISQARYNKYAETTQMAPHVDHIHSLFQGERKGVPILSVLGVLNDDFVGGEFMILNDYEVNLMAGDLLIFPSNFMYPHYVKPVKKGVRYSYISWVW